ncbi:MAG TPA: ATP-binding protein [Caulobacteraceae bacterium]|nr:ATP-binding protein [Caulobacteraceae bacterium]
MAAAVAPFAGWPLPLIWATAVLVCVGADERWRKQAARAGGPPGRFNPWAWLSTLAYSAMAFWLRYKYTGAAQILGVTLFGVVMFQVLSADYAAKRRLWANLATPIAFVILAQCLATAVLIRDGHPWQVITVFATPYVVFRTFRVIQQNLDRGRKAQREALAKLQQSEARFRVLAERSPDVLVRYGVDGTIEYLSPAARAYGWDPDKLIGASLAAVLTPAEQQQNRGYIADMAAGRSTAQGPDAIWRTHARDGREAAFERRSSPILDEDGKLVGVVTALRDVTERLALEDELRLKTAEAEAATAAKSQFLANMSHEIRTPLTGVIGFAGLLRSTPGLDSAAQRHVEHIHKSAEALLSVVNDVLDFSKLEADQVEFDPQPFDVPRFLEETADLVRGSANARGLEILVDLRKTAPRAVIGDAARLRQVMLNLLTNAVKFTDDGRVTVTADYLPDNERLIVAVSDTGAGIAPELAGRLFQRFSQIDPSNTRQHGGAGLGLAICKGLIEKMGGDIGVKSAPGAGSTFWFAIPAPLTDAQPMPADEPPPEITVGRARILLVDDVAVNRELVIAMLGDFEVDIVEAVSGAEAVEASLQQRFDLVLMDVQMPGMDGLAAAAAIRANSEINRATPIVALSANVLPAHVEACLAAGMNDHVAKPVLPRQLLAAIARWTSSAGEPEEPRAVA